MNCPHNRYRVQEYTLGGDKVIKSRRVCVDCGMEFDPSCPHTRSRIQGYSCEGGVIKSCRVCIDCGTEFDYEVLTFDPTDLQGDAEAAYYKMEGKIKELENEIQRVNGCWDNCDSDRTRLKEENAKLWKERDEFKVRIKNAYTFLEERDDELKGVYRLLDERNAEIARLREDADKQQRTTTPIELNERALDYLQTVYDVLLHGSEATEVTWDRLKGLSAVGEALKLRTEVARLHDENCKYEEEMRRRDAELIAAASAMGWTPDSDRHPVAFMEAEVARLRARVELQQGTITEVINHRDEAQAELAKLQGDLRVVAGWAINPNNLFNDTTYKLWLAKGSHIHKILKPWLEDNDANTA